TARQRALAGRGRAVDSNDRRDARLDDRRDDRLHADVSLAPTPSIGAEKPGKLVSMNAASSTAIGALAARPKTRALMARRWSMWVATVAPPGMRPGLPCTI